MVSLFNLSSLHSWESWVLSNGDSDVIVFLKKNQNASRPSEHPPVRGEIMSKRRWIKGCKYKTYSWHLNGFPDGNNIGSTV